MNNKKIKTGDMPLEEFRKYGHQLIDWAADYLQNIESYPVLPHIKPGDLKKRLPKYPPEKGEEFNKILKDVDDIIMPGMTHWNHPNFMAYFNSTASGPGILAELLSAVFNINGMIWKTSPASTELEQAALNWLRQMLGLPESFWGIIYDTASVSSMHAIAAAREQSLAGKNNLHKLRLYISEQAHSSIDKSALTLGIGLEGIRKIPVDDKFSMIPDELFKAIKSDKKKGLIPFCIVATVGTTSTTSIDNVEQVSAVSSKENIWLHVDAAHAGIAAIVPEMRFILKGIEKADSLVVNPHKWMFTPIDLSVLFTQKPGILKRAFSLVPEFLKTNEDNSAENYMDYGIQLGRRFRSLKLWFVIRYFGTEGIIERVREHIRLGQFLLNLIEQNSEFEVLALFLFQLYVSGQYRKPRLDRGLKMKMN